MSADLRQIVVADLRKNYQGRNVDEDAAVATYQKYIDLGKLVFVHLNVLIVYEVIGTDGIEFHCVNGGSGKDLTDAINSLLRSLSENYEWAVTYYDNPRINDLVKYSYFPATIDKIDDGLDRTYQMCFDLRTM